ncbi:MAG: hypothetical protein H6684_12690 [Deltaproteobacteria bacterium]|nr:hypothetical protein [Deltaproteobacteria bacterium]MCB9489581.1 hypothetical protein [Deltaproteobacteria bacterium]
MADAKRYFISALALGAFVVSAAIAFAQPGSRPLPTDSRSINKPFAGVQAGSDEKFAAFVDAFDKGDTVYIFQHVKFPITFEGQCVGYGGPRDISQTFERKDFFSKDTECVMGNEEHTVKGWRAALGLCRSKPGLGLDVFRYKTELAGNKYDANWELGEMHSRLHFELIGNFWMLTKAEYALPCPMTTQAVMGGSLPISEKAINGKDGDEPSIEMPPSMPPMPSPPEAPGP